MKKCNFKKILVIISIIILTFGIISGIKVSNDLEKSITSENINLDSSDVSELVKIGGVIGSKMLGTVIVVYSILIDIMIWITYGIISFVIKIIKKS